jgi:hypothetical protein
VKVYRFRLYDIASEDFKISRRLATPACIKRIRTELIRRTELEIDKKDLNPILRRNRGALRMLPGGSPVRQTGWRKEPNLNSRSLPMIGAIPTRYNPYGGTERSNPAPSATNR